MPARVISLLPSCTEIVCALGCGDWLAGRSHECDYPPEVQRLPVCTAAKIDSAASSRRIDSQIQDLLGQALSIFCLDLEQLQALQPDILLTQAQCEVCALTLKDLEQALAQWTGQTPRIVSVSPSRLAEIWESLQQIGEALGRPDRARELVKKLKERVVDVIEKACVLKERPSVACIEWLDPLMAAGNWMPELVELAGGMNLFGEAGKHSPWLEWETLAEADPQFMVVMPCGFGIERAREEMGALTRRPEWRKLRAVRKGNVYLTDGNSFFNRPGPRIVESLEILAELFHPKSFRFGHENSGWVRY